MSGTLTDDMEREHVLVAILARERERTRCLRIIARWEAFARRYAAPELALTMLHKAATEIQEGESPPWGTYEPPVPHGHWIARQRDGEPR